MWYIEPNPAEPLFYLLLLAGVVFLIQMYFYWGVFRKLAFFKHKAYPDNRFKPLSVVICAKNEYQNLKKHLPLILEQDYPDFEVVVVDDASDDDSHYLLRDFAEKYPHLKVVSFIKNVNFFSGKKFPLALGIKEARNEFMVFTDADCCPSSPQWLSSMQAHYNNPQTEVVLGYSPYKAEKSFLNALIRFETFYTALQYISFALSGVPYMGVGRNMSYRKKTFNTNKGFSSHYHIASGDDDIFISQVAMKKNTAIEIKPEALVYSVPKNTLAAWFKQKRRHYTTYPFYKKGAQWMLALLSASNLLFYLSLIALVLLKYNIIIAGALFILRLITQLIIFKKSLNKLSERKLLLFSPIFEIMYTVINPLLAFTNLVSPKKKWN